MDIATLAAFSAPWQAGRDNSAQARLPRLRRFG